MAPQIAPYGQWTSPLTAERLSTDSVSLHEVAVDESTGAIYSIECRPTEDGRFVIVQHLNGERRDVLPREFSAHAMVQELGGGSIAVRHDGRILFADENSCSIYLLNPVTAQAELIHPAEQGMRYADFSSHPTTPQWILAIKEDHREATPETQATHVHNMLVAIDLDAGKEVTIAQGDDFYSHPKFDPSGRYVSWIQWSHPDMPWTGTVLYVAEWQEGALTNVTRIAGKMQEESIAQPKWGLDGLLYFVSDRTGFWQLYSFRPADAHVRALVLEGLEQSDFAVAEWELGSSTYISLDETTLLAAVVTRATSKTVLINTTTCTATDLHLPYVDIGTRANGVHRVSKNSFAIVSSTTTAPQELSLITLTATTPTRTTLTSTAPFTIPETYISQCEEITVPGEHPIYSFYFPPRNPNFEATPNTLPPLLVYVHGGPNSSTTPALNLEIQYWTTRGFAVLAVNYTGSTGFGRAYRERLSGNWGVTDVADTVNTVKYLSTLNLINKTKVGIFGGSAGGYLTLQALHLYPDVWAAGISSYGISDVRALQADSYKFESQDVDRLLLSTTAVEEREQELRNRSPCYFAERMTAPLLLLQGTVDMVVPVAQARMMADAMRAKGRIAEVVEFEGEGHGWHGQKAIFESFTRKEEWWVRYLS
ncbi:Alpha/Beta hydrolase protein [Aspergillus avenaceus]|uniref:Prolyl endopeptidase n=1 Tax=Aspergillus avenaceus TaxID=36643 RepID=A0A5N6TX85_ASPAV|nr:Alpha/Beta hydrolase protein [Aspergillus avenaceus]